MKKKLITKILSISVAGAVALTRYALTAGELEDAADETEDAKAENTKTEDAAETTEKAQGKMLTVTGEDGTEHVFKNIDPDSWTEPVIYDEGQKGRGSG